MPAVLLPVPHFEQSRDGACLPACARMVLAFWGEKKSETAVARQGFVYLHDPAFSIAPQTVLWAAFLAAWAEYDETAVRITPL